MKIRLVINGYEREVDVLPDEYLLETLRELHYLSVKRGCDTTSCGVCTVLLDGAPVPSCSILSVKVDGHQVTTVEGIMEEASKLSEYFGKEGAGQCCYCNPSMALTVYAMKKELKDPSEEDIRNYLVGNLCRCTGYVSQMKAIKSYLEVE